jgi:hypothetical protein
MFDSYPNISNIRDHQFPKTEGDTKSLAYASLVCPILEYGAVCWDPYRECQISALDRVQNKAAKFVHHSGGSD